jgi:HJR/Mrr/RecB family endonuclease
MKTNEIRRIISELISYKWVGPKRLDLLMLEIIDSSKHYSASDKETYLDSLTDANSREFNKLIIEIGRLNLDNHDCQIINLIDDIDGYYLERAQDDDLDLYEQAIEKIDSFELFKNKKGTWFENFCISFLKDFGIDCKPTATSNDKGIDIYGSYKSNVNPVIGKLIRNEEIYILGQAKYFKEKVDTPVIRKLVGDSIFIRFDDLDYVEIKHNAVHLIVFSRNGFTEPAIKFAKKNKIELFDKIRIAHIISSNSDKDWKCLKIGN